ncbi:MAG: GIY-YIG nuclease family protein [Ignavibacteria bacterium]|nr:GIY-YIG nuclease family protein [Ignavibacteria bacterium]
MKKTFYVYILASKRNGTLYIGMTNDLMRRITEHKQKSIKGFTEKYNVTNLVYYEQTDYVNNAIAREKQLKGWLRKRKIELIESMNPNWEDLSKDWF